MKKILAAKIFVVLAAAVFSFALLSPSLAAHDVKPKHGPAHLRRAGETSTQPFAVSPVTPRVLDHRDPTRPGGLDPSFNPPPT